MTSAAADNHAINRSKSLAEIERITHELQAKDANVVRLLLERAQAHANLGDESQARDDISRAAALVKEPAYGSAESVAAVERALKEITISKGTGVTKVLVTSSDKDIVQMVSQYSTQKNVERTTVVDAVRVLEARIGQKRHSLETEDILELLSAFHLLCEHGDGEVAEEIGSCVRAALSGTAEEKPAEQMLVRFAMAVAAAWEAHHSDGGFKQLACCHGAGMYAGAAYALSKAKTDDTKVQQCLVQAFAFYISQIWMVGSLPAAEFKQVGQGLLRLLTANKPVFLHAFAMASTGAKKGAVSPLERLLNLLGEESGERHPLALLIVSQLVSAAKDPQNSSEFSDYNQTASARGTQTPPAIAALRTSATRILDTLVQSTLQAERTCGLLSLASLFEAGVGADLAGDLWKKSGWIEDLWDQGEFDKQTTQLALLKLADSSSSDVKLGAAMKEFGNGLVQELARKASSKQQADRDLADAAAIVLAKWSGAPAPAPTPAATATAQQQMPSKIEEIGDQASKDMGPMQLADIHMRRITECASKSPTDVAAASSMEKAVEALGYLCLKPAMKEHVAHNSSLLRSLFAFAQKSSLPSLKFSTIMLVRNLTNYRPVLTEEQKRMQQLQKLSTRAQSKSATKEDGSVRTVGDDMKDIEKDEEDALDSNQAVSERAELICKAGCVPVLVSAVQPKLRPSDSTKDAVAEVMVSLATTQTLRGLIVQQGGVRALLSIVTEDAPKAKSTHKDDQRLAPAYRQQRDKNIAFGLAKLAISVAPHLAFPDPREIVRLLLPLLSEESEPQSMLMKFECLLALTNLASSEPGSAHDVRGYMAIDLQGMSMIEMIMLSDHPLVRRAATELVCNLVYDQRVFERYAKSADKGVPEEDTPADVIPSGIVEIDDDDDDEAAASEGSDAYRSQRLHLLVALADVDDPPTRSAASGALAILTNDV
ncbi:SWI5-dependent HO expression protein 4 [Linderina macrospora]|uniref:SWI5-dependent HO expression protein 4 n=1 Tax=Linderina macrospora TaxID=4868 RepID=A0ACC1JF12_9FUNG|nr:SWI5-dependent HO expression protein 4 [Linderina macrospora]